MDKVVAVICLLCAPTWAQPSDINLRSTCFRGWTGADTGGSCSFNMDSLCDWQNMEGDPLTWQLTGDGKAVLSPGWFSDPERGRLRSPPMCEAPGRDVCLTVKFRFSSGGGSRLNVELCGQQVTCTSLFYQVYSDNTEWVVKTVPFVATASFKILIEGEKYEDTFGGESDIFIDYIQYNATSCVDETRVVSPTGMSSTDWTSSTMTSTVTGTHPSSSSSTLSSPLHSSSPAEVTEVTEGTSTRGTASTLAVAESDNEDRRVADNQGGGEEEGGGGEDNMTTIIIAVSVLLVLLLVVAVLITVVLVRRRHRSAPHKTTSKQTSARYEKQESVVMVTNELYTCVGQAPSMRLEEVPAETTREQDRRPATTTMTSAGRTPRGSDVYHSSMKRPVSSPPRVIAHEDNGTELQTILAASGAPKRPAPDRKEEDQVYENTDMEGADDKGLYENGEQHSSDEDKSVYENTATGHSESEPRASGADETYEKMTIKSTEYSHLIHSGKRPDRRQNNYDRLKGRNNP